MCPIHCADMGGPFRRLDFIQLAWLTKTHGLGAIPNNIKVCSANGHFWRLDIFYGPNRQRYY
jgi:hypothetical protein